MFFDDFNRPDEILEASVNWTRIGGSAGDASIESNLLSCKTTATSAIYWCPDQGSSDHYSACNFTASFSNAAGLAIRLTNISNFIGARYRNGNVELIKFQAGVASTLAISAQPGLLATDIIRLEAIGDNVRVLKNGLAIISVIESLNNTETRQGLVPRNSLTTGWIDNYEAGVVTASPSTVFPGVLGVSLGVGI